MAITISSTVSSPILGCMKNHKSKTAQGMRMKYSNEYETVNLHLPIIYRSFVAPASEGLPMYFDKNQKLLHF